MLSMLSGLITAFAAITAAAPYPALSNMINVVNYKQSKTSSSPMITSSSIGIGGVLGARDKAAGPLIDAGVDNGRKSHSNHLISVSSSPRSSSSPLPSSSYPSSNPATSGTLVLSLCGSQISLAPRHPAGGPIDAVNEHRNTRTTRTTATSTAIASADPECELFLTALEGNQPGVLPRNPAFNIKRAVGDGIPNESVIWLAGGSPVTLAANDIDKLNAVASEIPIPIAPFPSINAVISVAASPINNIPASLYDLPKPTSTGVRFDVAGTDTMLYLYSNPEQPIDKLSMGQVLAEAMSELQILTTKPNTDGWLPTSDWTYVRQEWHCIVTVKRNVFQGPTGLPQHLTYGILHSTMAGLWGALFSKGTYIGAKFEIRHREWGFVGAGSIAPWTNGTVPSH